MPFPISTFLVPRNNAESTLLSDITSSALSLILTSGGGNNFPSTFPFNISIDNEILQCTARIIDVLTVSRAQEGTSNATHLAGAAVRLNVTAKAIQDLNSAVNYMEVHWEDPISLNSGTITVGQSGISVIVQSGLGVIPSIPRQVITAGYVLVGAMSGGIQLSSGEVQGVVVRALNANSGVILMGGSINMPWFNVFDDVFGFPLLPGDTIIQSINNLNAIRVVASISGDRLAFSGIL